MPLLLILLSEVELFLIYAHFSYPPLLPIVLRTSHIPLASFKCFKFYLIYLQNGTIHTLQYLIHYLHYISCVTYITRIRLHLCYKQYNNLHCYVKLLLTLQVFIIVITINLYFFYHWCSAIIWGL